MPVKKETNPLILKLKEMYHGMVQRTKKRKKFKIENIIPKEEFMKFGINNENYKKLYQEWELSGKQLKFTPSVDRINNNIGYERNNIQFITFSDNVKKCHKEVICIKHEKKVKLISIVNNQDLFFKSGVEASLFLNINETAVGWAIKYGTKVKDFIPFLLNENNEIIINNNHIKNINNLIKTFKMKIKIKKDNMEIEFDSLTDAGKYLNTDKALIFSALKFNHKAKGWIVEKIETPIPENILKILEIINQKKGAEPINA